MKELEELEDKLDSTESKLTATLDKLLVEEKKKDECERAKGVLESRGLIDAENESSWRKSSKNARTKTRKLRPSLRRLTKKLSNLRTSWTLKTRGSNNSKCKSCRSATTCVQWRSVRTQPTNVRPRTSIPSRNWERITKLRPHELLNLRRKRKNSNNNKNNSTKNWKKRKRSTKKQRGPWKLCCPKFQR